MDEKELEAFVNRLALDIANKRLSQNEAIRLAYIRGELDGHTEQ